jgi:S-disulfanyl-L-cysteine oxidoreductase SoxD
MRGASNPDGGTAAPGLLPATQARGRNDGQKIGSLFSWRRLRFVLLTALAAVFVTIAFPAASLAGESYGIGRTATPEEIAGWNIDISPDGAGLPPGHGSVAEGHAIFDEKCAACHGAHGEGKPMDRLVGGFGTVFDVKSERTVGSFWPYATTLFDFVRRAMPFDAPQSLTPDQVYAVCAYVLYLNKLVPEDAVLDAQTLPKIEMPNRFHFVSAFKPRSGGPAP